MEQTFFAVNADGTISIKRDYQEIKLNVLEQQIIKSMIELASTIKEQSDEQDS